MSKLAFFEATASDSPSIGGDANAYEILPSVVMLAQPNDPQAEAIRGLRAHLMVQHIEAGRRALVVCAPNADVGSTFVASNLAVALSQAGVRTLLVDADLRSAGVATLFRPQQAVRGLRWCLEHPEATYEECVDLEVLPNLSIMFAGEPGADGGELLAGSRFETVMDDCLRDFDCTIIDTPPANQSSEARRVASVGGYALIVARRHRTHVADVKTLIEQLESDHIKVVGTVLNEG